MRKNTLFLIFLVIFILLHYARESKIRSEYINKKDIVFSHQIWVKKLASASNCYIWFYEVRSVVPGCDTWSAGDVLSITGRISYLNASPETSQKVLIKNVKVTIKEKEVSLKTRLTNSINTLSYLFFLKSQDIFLYLGERNGLLMFSLIFGQSWQLPVDLRQKLQLAGLPYLISVSSYSFSLTIESFFLFAKKFPHKKRGIELCCLFVVSLYVLLVGYPAALQRVAFALIIDYLSKRIFYRPILPIYRLFLSSLVILLLSPYSFYDVGFELSALSSLGINLFPLPPKSFVRFLFFLRRREKFQVGKLLWFPVAAQLISWPVLFYSFGDLNLLSPISSLLVAFILPIILTIGCVYWLIGQFYMPILPYISPLLNGPLAVFLAEINMLARFPLLLEHQFNLEKMALGYCLITFFIIGRIIYHKRYIRQSISYDF